MEKNMNIKEKVKLVAETIEENDDNNGFNYFEDLISFYFSNDPDISIIKEKLNNLISLMAKKKNEGAQEFEKFIDLDFENEVWYMI